MLLLLVLLHLPRLRSTEIWTLTTGWPRSRRRSRRRASDEEEEGALVLLARGGGGPTPRQPPLPTPTTRPRPPPSQLPRPSWATGGSSRPTSTGLMTSRGKQRGVELRERESELIFFSILRLASVSLLLCKKRESVSSSSSFPSILSSSRSSTRI